MKKELLRAFLHERMLFFINLYKSRPPLLLYCPIFETIFFCLVCLSVYCTVGLGIVGCSLMKTAVLKQHKKSLKSGLNV